jgi:hypothetical protein
VEALGMIADERAIPMLEAFEKKIPQGIGYGGFLSNFLGGAVKETLADLKVQTSFWAAVRRHPGLEEKVAPVFEHLRADPVARFRMQEDEVIRGTEEGRAVLAHLAAGDDAVAAAGAKALLANFDELGR